MTVGANTYGSVAGVQALVGDLVDSRTFSGSTVPTTTQVEAFLDDMAADLNRELEAAGYTVPVNSTNYPTAYAWLAKANEHGAAALVLVTMPQEGFDPAADVEAGGTSRSDMYIRLFNSALKVIANNKLKAGRDRNRMAGIYAGARLDSSGDEKTPLFTRTLHEYPGLRSTAQEPD